MGNKSSTEFQHDESSKASIKERRNCLTAGYIRHNTRSYIPDSILDLIMSFYYDKDISQFLKKYKLKNASSQWNSKRTQQCYNIYDSTICIVKKVNIKRVQKKERKYIDDELRFMSIIHHPNIVAMYDIYINKNEFIYIVLECVEIELFDMIIENDCIEEKYALILFKQLLSALQYIHNLGIVHRNIKPETLLLATKELDDKCQLKLRFFSEDLGVAACIYDKDKNGYLRTPTGTPNYAAPEVLSKNKYGTQSDLWSAGVVLYIILVGYPPFYSPNNNYSQLFKKIKNGEYEMSSTYWDNISDDAKDLVKQLLQTDPNKRFTASQGLEHIWINKKQ